MYSTCTFREEENEKVVKNILENNQDFVLKENLFKEWKIRGLKEYDEIGSNTIRFEKDINSKSCFFVACFVRKSLINQKKRKLDLIIDNPNKSKKIKK
jgi:16S rRNA C967 or C1407 C5-methylase (RsmB/RsmF family)